jgi:hypothetical protein
MSADIIERTYNDPTLSPLDFLLAVAHDDHLPMSVRTDAAQGGCSLLSCATDPGP